MPLKQKLANQILGKFDMYLTGLYNKDKGKGANENESLLTKNFQYDRGTGEICAFDQSGVSTQSHYGMTCIDIQLVFNCIYSYTINH